MTKTATHRLSFLLLTCLLLLLSGLGAQAQVRIYSPSATDPGYDARKAAASLSQPAAVQVRPSSVARLTALPPCFEAADTVSTPANGGFTALPRDDDNSVGPLPLGFSFSLFGTVYTSCYINNNGNITFGAPLAAFSPQGFPNSTPMITAFWGDVDTRATTSGHVWYKVYPDRLVVLWNKVASYKYNQNMGLKNTFELIIRRNTGAGAASPDVTFAYGDMQWTTGTATGGVAGFGGSPATVGVNQGGSAGKYIQTGRFNQNSADPPQATYTGSTYSGVHWLDNRCLNYTVAPAGNLPPTATGFPESGILTVRQGQTANLALQFAGPEAGQSVAVTVNTNGLCNTAAPTTSGASPIVNLSVTGAACNVGTHQLSFQATDDGAPAASATFNLTVTVLPPPQWTGAVNTAYELPGNWNTNAVPAADEDVLIPAGVTYLPMLTTAQAAANVTVAAGASLTIAAGGELTLTGTLQADGPCQGLGAVRATGTSQQTLGGASGLLIGQLTVGPAGARLAGPLQVQRVLLLNGTLTTNAQLCTLRSDAGGTAIVVNNGLNQVIGDVRVQRYLDPSLNAGLGYRHLAAPVQNTTLDDLAVSSQFTPSVNPAYNIMGATARPFPTVFSYDETRLAAATADFDQGWLSPATTTAAMVPGSGYTVNLAGGLTVDFVGALTNGAVSRSGLTRGAGANAGWHLLGNPYPAPLDWDLVYPQTSGLDDAVYVFKSNGASPYTGSYAAYVNRIGNSSARYLGVGQAFFVRVSAAGTPGALPFSNAMRLTSYQNVALQRTTADSRPQLRLELVGSTPQVEETYVYFEAGATAGFDRTYDAYKVPGGSQLYLATGTGSQAYSINGLPILPVGGTTVPLLTYVPQAGTYTLRVGESLNFDAATRLWLEDRRSGAWQDLKVQPSLTFQVSHADAAATRFVLHFGQSQALANVTQLPAEAVQLYPNPANGQLHLDLAGLPKGAVQIMLLNALGQAVQQQEFRLSSGDTNITLDIHNLTPGVYNIRGTTAMHTFTRNVVIN